MDKLLHFLVGGYVFAVVFPLLGFSMAVAAVIIAAVGKEVYDHAHRENHTPDALDAVATLAGAIPVGVLQFV